MFSPNIAAISVIAKSAVEYDLVAGTAISFPAKVEIAKSAICSNVEFGLFEIARVAAPFCFAHLSAAIVSLVSPDCETAIAKVFLKSNFDSKSIAISILCG